MTTIADRVITMADGKIVAEEQKIAGIEISEDLQEEDIDVV